jgi:hypothetical protein
MSRVTVRAAVAAYFTNADLAMVGKVYAARPEIVNEQDYETNRLAEAVESVNGSSAVLVVNIPSDSRQRRADTGRGAVNDSNIHKIVMEVFFGSTGGHAVKAQEDYDAIIDGMIDLIRANANLEAPATVWSAGEYAAGIQHQQSEPFTDADGLVVFISGAVSFDAWEWISGNV